VAVSPGISHDSLGTHGAVPVKDTLPGVSVVARFGAGPLHDGRGSAVSVLGSARPSDRLRAYRPRGGRLISTEACALLRARGSRRAALLRARPQEGVRMTATSGPGSRSPTPRCATTTSSCTPPMTLAWRRLARAGRHPWPVHQWRVAKGGGDVREALADRRLARGKFRGGNAAGRSRGRRRRPRAAPGWAGTPWLERIAVMRRMADLISERQMSWRR